MQVPGQQLANGQHHYASQYSPSVASSGTPHQAYSTVPTSAASSSYKGRQASSGYPYQQQYQYRATPVRMEAASPYPFAYPGGGPLAGHEQAYQQQYHYGQHPYQHGSASAAYAQPAASGTAAAVSPQSTLPGLYDRQAHARHAAANAGTTTAGSSSNFVRRTAGQHHQYSGSNQMW